MVVHFAKESFSNWKSRLRTNDRIDSAFGTQCGVIVVNPIFDFSRRKNSEAIKASTIFARQDFFSMPAAMFMGANVILLFDGFHRFGSFCFRATSDQQPAACIKHPTSNSRPAHPAPAGSLSTNLRLTWRVDYIPTRLAYTHPAADC